MNNKRPNDKLNNLTQNTQFRDSENVVSAQVSN